MRRNNAEYDTVLERLRGIAQSTKKRGICCPECGMYKDLSSAEYIELLERQ